MNWAMRVFQGRGVDPSVDTLLDRYGPLMATLTAALDLLPQAPTKQLYRGLNCRLDGRFYKEGNVVLMQGFTSTTASSNVVKEFVPHSPGHEPEGTIFLLRPMSAESVSRLEEMDGPQARAKAETARHGRGAVVSFLSEFPKEDEVLFRENLWVEVRQAVGVGAKEVLRAHIGIDLDR